jgi:hypothetical protein
VKKGYVPDFGYENALNFEEKKDFGWLKLAKQVTRKYPKYDKFANYIKTAFENKKN